MKPQLKAALIIIVVFTTWTGIVVYAGTIGNSLTGFVNAIFAGYVQCTTVNTGQGANELYDMDQNVLTTSNPTFNNITVSSNLTLGGVSRDTWPSGGGVGNYTEVTEDNGVSLGPRDRLNFIEGGNVTLSLVDDAANNQVNITISAVGGASGGPFNYSAITENNGVTSGPRSRINFIEGDNITIAIVDDAGNDQVNITITSTGGAGGPGASGEFYFGASLIMFQNATGYYVQSGHNGSILAGGADAGALLNTYCKSNEDLYMQPGDYLITTKVSLSGIENMTLRGGGKGTRLYQEGTCHNPIVGLSNCKAIHVKDLYVDGNTTVEGTAFGIQVFNTNDSLIQNCFISDVNTHGICFLNYSYNNLVDGCVVWDNGYDGIFGTHGASTPTIQRSIISNNLVYDNGRDGISANWGVKWSIINNKAIRNPRWNIHTCGAPMCQITDNECYHSGDDSIYITTATSGESIVSDNYIEGAGAEGIDIAAGDLLTISGNIIVDVEGSAIKTVGTTNTAIDSNQIYNCSTGIYTSTGKAITITGNSIRNITGGHGITPVQCTGMSIIGNTLETIARYGIYLDRTDDSIVDGNNLLSYSFEDNQWNGLRLSDADDNQVTDNIFRQGTGNAYYAIYIDSLALRNIIIDNDLRSGGSLSALINNFAPSTIYDSVVFQFTEAVGGEIRTISPTGIKINVTSEEGLVWGQLPADIQCVKRIKIWGVALGAPLGAGGQMHLEITFNAGAANAAYNTATKSWSISDFDGEEANYVANDVIWWNIEDGDCGSELRNLEAGDSFEMFVSHNAGAEPDGETDLVVRCVEFEYV